MPLEDLDTYGSDSGSSIQSRNSETVPKTPQDDSDSNATGAESNGELSEEEIFDGQSHDSDQHTPGVAAASQQGLDGPGRAGPGQAGFSALFATSSQLHC